MLQRVIVAGRGRIGGRAAAVVGDYGHDPVVIERDADRCDQFDDPPREIVTRDDGTRPDVVGQAGPERADAVAATGAGRRHPVAVEPGAVAEVRERTRG